MQYIYSMNTSNFYLNLLRVFDMLLREQNASRAAERLALTQSTVSNTLARLRVQFSEDPLNQRSDGGNTGRRLIAASTSATSSRTWGMISNYPSKFFHN